MWNPDPSRAQPMGWGEGEIGGSLSRHSRRRVKAATVLRRSGETERDGFVVPVFEIGEALFNGEFVANGFPAGE